MNLVDLIAALRDTLRRVHESRDGADAYEIHVDVRLIEEIEWHLSNYQKTAGNPSRPAADREYRDRKQDYWEGGPYEQVDPIRRDWEQRRRRTAEEAEAKSRYARGEAERNARQQQAYAEEFARGFRESFRRSSTWEEVFGGFKSGFEGFDFGGNQSRQERPRPQSTRAWWEVLGVRQTCTWPEAQRAYRSAALKAHPDKGGSKDKMQELNVAKDNAKQFFGVK